MSRDFYLCVDLLFVVVSVGFQEVYGGAVCRLVYG